MSHAGLSGSWRSCRLGWLGSGDIPLPGLLYHRHQRMNLHAVLIIFQIVVLLFAISLHEAAHGYAALALGDDTARLAGRLSLNPLRHIDRVGTILLPGFLLLFQLLTIHRVVFMFGWA